jgi:hypothetical protein
VAPPKPDRDFTKFKSNDELDSSCESAETVGDFKVIEDETQQQKLRVRRGISRENLPSPPATPMRKSATPTITVETIELTITENKMIQQNDKKDGLTGVKEISKSTESLKEEIEANSHQITNLVDELIKKAYGMSAYGIPEDIVHNVHEETIEPTSKLAVRKISTGSRKTSTEVQPIIENDQVIELSHINAAIDVSRVQAKRGEEKDESLVKAPIEKTQDDKTTMNDILEEIYNRNSEVMREFQSFLEQPVSTKDENVEVFEASSKIESKYNDEELDNQSYSDSFESSDTEIELNGSKVDEKRPSIEDVENWFSNHIELEQKESEVFNAGGEVKLQSGYDTHKIFPFGKTIEGRRDSVSDEFFTPPTTSSAAATNVAQQPVIKRKIEIVKENSISEDDIENYTDSRESSKSPDHSTLLKILTASKEELSKN